VLRYASLNLIFEEHQLTKLEHLNILDPNILIFPYASIVGTFCVLEWQIYTNQFFNEYKILRFVFEERKARNSRNDHRFIPVVS
jgi:hypothetical protein